MPFTFLRMNLYMDFLPRMVLPDGVIAGPAGHGRVASVLRDDVADAAVAVLTEEGHEGRTYDITGSEALTFAEIAERMSRGTGSRSPFTTRHLRRPTPPGGAGRAGLGGGGLGHLLQSGGRRGCGRGERGRGTARGAPGLDAGGVSGCPSGGARSRPGSVKGPCTRRPPARPCSCELAGRPCRLSARLPRHVRDARHGGRGRPAAAVAGNPEQPVTAGFLCGKVSNYLDRVYSADRVLHPLVRDGPRAREFRRASWDEALDGAAEGLRAAIDEHGGEVDPALQLHGHAGADPGQPDERAGDERARARPNSSARSAPRRGSPARSRPTGSPPRSTPSCGRGRATCCCGAGTRCPPRRTSGADPGGAPGRGAARGGRPVPQPHGAGGGRAPGADPGHRRRAGAGDDARGVDAGLQDEDWCRAHTRATTSCSSGWAIPGGALRGGLRGGRGEIARVGRGSPDRAGAAAPRAWGPSATTARRRRTARSRRLPALTGAWRQVGGGCSYIPTATAAGELRGPAPAQDLRPGRCARSTCRRSGARSPTPRSTRR